MKKMKLNKLARGEKGQALIIVVLLMLVSALIITPMLSHVSTGLKTGKEVYEERMELFYAADSGVEDGLWQIKSENLEALFTSPAYDPYDFSQVYEYPSTLDINDNDVEVDIENIWIPKDITAPDPSSARDIIEAVDLPKLVISGGVSATSTYQINIAYYYDNSEDPDGDDLDVDTVGIWLPPGFEYAGNCSLEGETFYSTPANDDYCSGKAVVWSFSSVPLVNFPGSGGSSNSIERSFTFEFTGPSGQNPGAALSWVNTSGVDDLSYTWDADVKVYKVTSTATDAATGKETVVDAYTAKSELRELGTSISGDYCAVGNTLMEATGYGLAAYFRDRLYRQSSADVTNITLEDIEDLGGVPPGSVPENAQVDAAYLYWSGWMEGDEGVVVVFQDPCDTFDDNWDPGSHWTLNGGEFEGQGSGTNGNRTLEMFIWNNPPGYNLDLSAYSGQEVTVSWEQREWESGWGWPPPALEWDDTLYYAFSGDGGAHWSGNYEAFHDDNPPSTFSATIPDEYVTSEFRMRFFLDFDSTSEYCYLDNITITAPAVLSVQNVADAKVNRVIFNDYQVTANLSDCQVAASDDAAPGAWCYSCFYDATDLVEQLIDDGDIADNGTGTYTLGHWMEGNDDGLYPSGSTDYPLGTRALYPDWSHQQYQWSYAGWSLIIIYSSPETRGHQLYLFPEFRYVKVHTTLEFPISGFLVPAQIPGEEIAAHVTTFVGDGDEQYSGDYIALINQAGDPYKLSDGVNIGAIQTIGSHQWFSNPYDNVWNGKFMGPSGVVDGIDIDTFEVSWSSGVLTEGDFSADVVLGNASTSPNDAELIMVVYIIVSFRSSITSGGTLSYLVRG